MIGPPPVLSATAVAAAVATAFLVGGSDDAPAPPDEPAPAVSAEEFCTGFAELASAREAQLRSASRLAVAELRAAVARVDELAAGTRMSETARAGVEFLVTVFGSLPDDATADDVAAADARSTVTDDVHAQALEAYLGERC